jgi:very-short-patch-repair endonuclease
MATYRDNQARVTLLERCRSLRKAATDAETLLWWLLRARQVAGAKFRRQHQFGPYILDFYCHQHRLVVEVDGGQHTSSSAQVAKDAQRTAYLASRGIHVLRFTNLEVLQGAEGVIDRIWDEVEEPSPNPLPKGEGVAPRLRDQRVPRDEDAALAGTSIAASGTAAGVRRSPSPLRLRSGQALPSPIRGEGCDCTPTLSHPRCPAGGLRAGGRPRQARRGRRGGRRRRWRSGR